MNENAVSDWGKSENCSNEITRICSRTSSVLDGSPLKRWIQKINDLQLDELGQWISLNFMMNGDFKIAEALLVSAVDKWPNNPIFYLLLGICQHHSGIRYRAQASFETALKLDQFSCRLILTTIESYLKLVKATSAEEWFSYFLSCRGVGRERLLVIAELCLELDLHSLCYQALQYLEKRFNKTDNF